MKEQEFNFLALSPENESLRPYRQHISMADSYVLCVERGEKYDIISMAMN